jgi:hypothetical protein
MTKRVLLAGLLGGIAMFIWSSVAHMALPLGEAGVKEIPSEPAVLQAMVGSIGQVSGFYFFPGTGLKPDATKEEKQAATQQYDQKLAMFPSGILIYHPPGTPFVMPQKLATEFATELIESLLVVILLVQTRLSRFASRLGFVVGAGVLAAIATNIPYWNWYGFPNSYTLGYMTTQIVGFLCVGLVAAALLKEREPASVAAPAAPSRRAS